MISFLRIPILTFTLFSSLGCGPGNKINTFTDSNPAVKVSIAGAMKNVMWKGELDNSIDLDTIGKKEGLYGLGPLNQLKGELLVMNGTGYASKVNSGTTMSVEKGLHFSAPFFVYANVLEWKEIQLPSVIKTISDLETYLDNHVIDIDRPFPFKLTGQVAKAQIHVQNLPEGTLISSPQDAHQGQVIYDLTDVSADILGFFSTEHQGIFTHHDSFVHLHLITSDEQKMGHVDKLEIDKMKLFLPK